MTWPHRYRYTLVLPALLLVLLPTCRRSPTGPGVPLLAISTEALPPAAIGVPYAQGVQAEGGDGAYDWDITAGALPAGLTLLVDDLSEDLALITGTPQQVQTATFTLRVRSGDGQTSTRQFTLAVLSEPVSLTVLTPGVPPALQGASYAVLLQATGGDTQTNVWDLIAGGLPAGLSLTTEGRIQGTPSTIETTTFTVRVRSGSSEATREMVLRVVVHDTQRYRITIFPVVSIPANVMTHVVEAVAQWEAATVGNLPQVTIPESFFGASNCGGFGTFINGASTDDILLILNLTPIDGPGKILGQAGPCAVRSASSLPFAGIVTLDIDDLTPIVGTETLTDILAHEIAHALGFGTLWPSLGFLQGAGTNDPRYTGPLAVAEWQALGGTGSVPLENQGGAGTVESHWRKTVFQRELMTGFVEPVGIDQPLSRVSIAAQADLGYTVNMAAADDFALGSPGALHADRDPSSWGELGWDEIYAGPILVLKPDGRGATLEPR